MTTYARGERKREPTHPGVILKEIVLPELGLTVTKAAEVLGVSRQYLTRVLGGRTAMSAEFCFKVGKLAGNGGELWMNMQTTHNIWRMRRDAKIRSVLAAIPGPEEFATRDPASSVQDDKLRYASNE